MTTTPAALDVHALAEQVAQILGPDWDARPDDSWSHAQVLHHTDGRRIRLYDPTYGSAGGRLHMEGLLPRLAEGDEEPDRSDLDSGEISVAGTSPARRVAAELTRRLLPKLDVATAESTRRLEALRTAEQVRLAAANQLAAVPGLSTPVRHSWDRRVTAYRMSWDGPKSGESSYRTPSARLEVDADRKTGEAYTVMELRGLSPEQAVRVMRALVDEAS